MGFKRFIGFIGGLGFIEFNKLRLLLGREFTVYPTRVLVLKF